MRRLALLVVSIMGASVLIASLLDARTQQFFGRADQPGEEAVHHVRAWTHHEAKG